MNSSRMSKAKYLYIIITITKEINVLNQFLMLYYLFKGTSIYFYYVVLVVICNYISHKKLHKRVCQSFNI